MTIRFTAASHTVPASLARHLCISVILGAANDNPLNHRRLWAQHESVAPHAHSKTTASRALLDDAPLAAALMHFARHGFAAGAQARAHVARAHADNDVALRQRWIEICSRLDDGKAQARIGLLSGC